MVDTLIAIFFGFVFLFLGLILLYLLAALVACGITEAMEEVDKYLGTDIQGRVRRWAQRKFGYRKVEDDDRAIEVSARRHGR